jgi:hypothetical protein
VPTLRKKPGGRRFRRIGSERHAKRLPKGLKPSRPGELVQIDTVFVSLAPGRSHKQYLNAFSAAAPASQMPLPGQPLDANCPFLYEARNFSDMLGPLRGSLPPRARLMRQD